MTFLPSATVLVTYTIACVVLFVTPGPDMSLMLAKTLAGGRRAGFAALVGTTAGCLVQTTLAALGISALLAASVTAFTILKIVGAIYLIWLAISAVRHGSALRVDGKPTVAAPFWRTALVGLGINLTNPKVVIFFVTFLPLFVDGHDPHAASKLLFLGLYFLAISTPLSIALVLAAEAIVATLKRRPRVMRAIDYGFAGLFGTFALKILTVQAR
ncbi:LysE family translocator [Chelatococcus sp. GCM10030263]|uniref:LysE family translocator n=1 Tax=Chelatococcus sp. GCM10030263 TaxID=3273387 RepID=UPI003624471C